jgi:SET domain-containing protein
MLILVTAVIASGIAALLHGRKPAHGSPIVEINREYEERTMVRKSWIPNAGDGLFAAVKIRRGEVVGELGGRLVADEDYPADGEYVASLAECAREKTRPYKYVDSRENSGNVSRINFAPSEINGIPTNFQNAAIKQICEYPYIVFVALKDIEPGAEIWSSYGPDYEYDAFMTFPPVRDFFCGLLVIDCSEQFSYSH